MRLNLSEFPWHISKSITFTASCPSSFPVLICLSILKPDDFCLNRYICIVITSTESFADLAHSMQVAAFLSDLKSLSVCPHQAAIDLVSAHRTVSGESKTEQEGRDLQRASELMRLHTSVKMKHIDSGPDQELLSARQTVNSILRSLNDKS